MRPFLIVLLMIFLLMVCVCLCPMTVNAQYFGFNPFWTFQQGLFFPPFPPWSIEPVFSNPMYNGRPFAMPLYPMPITSPILLEPKLRRAMAPVTLTVPTVTVTTAPLTAILGFIDPTLLAANVAVLSSILNPTVFNLLVTTFQLPFLSTI